MPQSFGKHSEHANISEWLILDRQLILTSFQYPRVALRAIAESDLDNLRTWKNDHRQFFFFKGIISRQGQAQWFEGYRNREHDYMFIVVVDGRDVGCMGVRLLDNVCDIYNVILGIAEMGGQGHMSHAFSIMCSYGLLKYSAALTIKVLSDNPNTRWYKRNGFKDTATHEGWLELGLDWTVFRQCPVTENTVQPTPRKEGA